MAATITTQAFSTGATSFAVNLPASPQGKVVVAFITAANGPTLSEADGDFTTLLASSSFSYMIVAEAWRPAGSTLTIGASATCVGVAIVIDDPDAVNQASDARVATGSSTAPNSPRSPNTGDWLWGSTPTTRVISLFGQRRGNSSSAATEPTNYSVPVTNFCTGGVDLNSNAWAAASQRDVNAVSEDPGAFTSNVNNVWHGYTIAWEVAAAGGAFTRIVGGSGPGMRLAGQGGGLAA